MPILQDQKIRRACGEVITSDVYELPPDHASEQGDYTPGTTRIGDREMALEQFECCFNGDQWIELAIREGLIAWAKSYFHAEVVGITSLVWDPDKNYWVTDLWVDGDDAGVAFSFDDEYRIGIEYVCPYSIVIHF